MKEKLDGSARAVAHANIALAKYWGKSDVALNLPAVPSISLTLDALRTTTTVTFDPALRGDEIFFDRRRASPKEARRVVELLDRVRNQARARTFARVQTKNDFPTAAGLASSASGFAALAAAASAAANLRVSHAELSRMARQSSASAARSIFGGFVELPAGRRGDNRLAAKALSTRRPWDVRVVIVTTAAGPKDVGSTEGMERSRRTSPLYAAWLDAAPGLTATIRRGIRARDLETVGTAMEQSTLAFHACAMTSDPPIFYWNPITMRVLKDLLRLRGEHGIAAYATMDAGPHVKVFCVAHDAKRVKAALAKIPGVEATFIAAPGPGVTVTRLGTRPSRRR